MNMATPSGNRMGGVNALPRRYSITSASSTSFAANMIARERSLTELYVTKEQALDYLQWLDEAGLRRLSAIADKMKRMPDVYLQ